MPPCSRSRGARQPLADEPGRAPPSAAGEPGREVVELPHHVAPVGHRRSAAADGVAARRSATRSESETSISCPTAEMVGTGHAASARQTASSLNAQRSSRAPPPRPMIRRSSPRHRLTQPERATQLRDRAVALHPGRRRAGSAAAGPALARDGDDVAERGAVGARDDRDRCGEARQRALARRIEAARRAASSALTRSSSCCCSPIAAGGQHAARR